MTAFSGIPCLLTLVIFSGNIPGSAKPKSILVGCAMYSTSAPRTESAIPKAISCIKPEGIPSKRQALSIASKIPVDDVIFEVGSNIVIHIDPTA